MKRDTQSVWMKESIFLAERKAKVTCIACDFESHCTIYWLGIDGTMNWTLSTVSEWTQKCNPLAEKRVTLTDIDKSWHLFKLC